MEFVGACQPSIVVNTNFDFIVNYRFITSAKVSYATTKSKKLMIDAKFFLLEPAEQVEKKYPDEWNEANPAPPESNVRECMARAGINPDTSSFDKILDFGIKSQQMML